MNDEIDIIISRYFSGEASEKELLALDNWLSESDENEKMFHQMNLLYQCVGQTNMLPTIDIGNALLQFKNYIHKKQKNNYPPFFKSSIIWKAAAVIAMLIISAFSLFYFINKPSEETYLMATETSKECKLFKNTNVTLYSGSEIVYNAKSKQEVLLIGKATFKTSEEIIVQAGETFIKNFGTIFTVDATNSDKFITVEVSEGEVWFYTNTNAGIHLKSDEISTYDVQIKQFNTIVGTQHATSLQQELIFQNTPLFEAIDIIKKHYNIEIIIVSNTPNDVLLNVSFDKKESIENVLDIITATISAKWSKKNGAYIIEI